MISAINTRASLYEAVIIPVAMITYVILVMRIDQILAESFISSTVVKSAALKTSNAVTRTSKAIGALDHEIKGQAKTDEATSRLMTVPGVGPMCATTIQAFAPPMEEFSNGREFAA